MDPLQRTMSAIFPASGAITIVTQDLAGLIDGFERLFSGQTGLDSVPHRDRYPQESREIHGDGHGNSGSQSTLVLKEVLSVPLRAIGQEDSLAHTPTSFSLW